MLFYLVHDYVLEELVDIGLVQQMIAHGWDGDKRWPEADCKVEHHVLTSTLSNCQINKWIDLIQGGIG